MKKKIDLVFTLKTPFSSGSPETAYFNFETRYFTGSAEGGGFPCTRTARMPIARSITAQTEELDNSNPKRHNEYPIIPVNTLRGLLRREGANMIHTHLKERGEKISLDLFHLLDCGAHSAAPAKINSVELMKNSISHPYLGLFGGGPQLSPSFYTITNGMPIVNDLVEEGYVPEFLSDLQPCSNRRITEVIHIRRVDGALTFNTMASPEMVDNYDVELTKWIDGISGNKKARADGAKKSDLTNMAAQEFVIPGVSFHSEIVFDDRGPGKPGLGMLLHALAGLSDKAFGMRVANGCGKMQLQAYLNEDGSHVPLFDTEGELNMACDTVSEAMDAYAGFAGSVDTDSLEKLFTLKKADS